MTFLGIIAALLLSYMVGSIPSGLLVVRLINGRDIRNVGSGRTGGTNAMRAAGLVAGLMTGVMDVTKGVASGWISTWLAPGMQWVQVGAALMAILGHNYSIFLPERMENGKWKLRGGAGGAPALGGAIALWHLSWIYILPVGVLVFIFVGYASVTTMSIALVALIVFFVRAVDGFSPWSYVVYSVMAELLLLWALRPNLKRLKEGTERLVGLRAYLQKKAEEKLGHKHKSPSAF
jgi:acyl phosphate:glycerol-3-phosphate acyltransferase